MIYIFRRRVSSFQVLALFVAIFQICVAKAHAIDIKEIETKSGIKAYLVEDYTLPIIAMSYSFKGGSTQDDTGKEGTLRMMTALMDEGAGELDKVAFQSQLEELGIGLNFNVSYDSFSGSMRTVRSELDTASQLLKLAINQPRFDSDATERMRDAFLRGIERSETNPQFQARKAFRETLFPGHPYERNTGGTAESIKAITRDDLFKMKEKILSQETLAIGVVGAISADELGALIESVFGGLPEKSGIDPVRDISPTLGEEMLVEMPTPNASIQLVYSGIERSDPDYFAAHLMSYILGGGSFSSRLYREVREKRGLAYGIYSGISTYDHSEVLVAGTSTRAENGDQVISVMLDEIRTLVDTGVTSEELERAKRYVTGAYAINNLDTSGKIAGVLVTLQTENLGIDYIDKRVGEIERVTLEDVNRMAKKLLSVQPTRIIVRPALTQ